VADAGPDALVPESLPPPQPASNTALNAVHAMANRVLFPISREQSLV